MKILLLGATGFLGRHLLGAALEQGHQPIVVARAPEQARRLFPEMTVLSEVPAEGDFDAVINLAGAPIFDAFWSEKRKRELWQSRVDLTRDLVERIQCWPTPAKVLLNASAVGIYGDGDQHWLNERQPLPAETSDFSQALCLAWESAARNYSGGRIVLLRTGLVLGADGGLLSRLRLQFSLGLGGRLGSGKQWMSWIHVQDWTRATLALLHDDSLQGPINLVAPEPVTNAEFSQTLARLLNRPAFLPQPEWLLKSVLGERADLLFVSQRVKPEKLLTASFPFDYPDLESALSAALNRS